MSFILRDDLLRYLCLPPWFSPMNDLRAKPEFFERLHRRHGDKKIAEVLVEIRGEFWSLMGQRVYGDLYTTVACAQSASPMWRRLVFYYDVSGQRVLPGISEASTDMPMRVVWIVGDEINDEAYLRVREDFLARMERHNRLLIDYLSGRE